MDYLLNTYVFQYLPFHVSDPARQYVIDKAVSLVRVRQYFSSHFGVDFERLIIIQFNILVFRLPTGFAKHKILESCTIITLAFLHVK